MAHLQFPNNTVYRVHATIPNSALKALNTSPYEIVAPPGGNLFPQVLAVACYFNAGTETLVDPGSATFFVATTNNTILSRQLGVTGVLTGTTDTLSFAGPFTSAQLGSLSDLGTGIRIRMDTGDLTGNASNDATLEVDVVYTLRSVKV